jgi:hypothetical protein
MNFFQFLGCFVPQKELTDEQQQQHDFYWQTQGANYIRMPSMYKVEYSEASQKEIQATWEAKRDIMDSYLESENYEAYAEMQYVEPKQIQGYHSWSTDEGKELYMARLDLQKVSKHIDGIRFKPHYYEIENDTIRRAKQRVAQAKKAFDGIAEKMVQEDLFHYQKKKKYELGRARQAKEREESEAYKERQQYNAEMRKAGQLATQLFDYSNGHEDTKVKDAKKGFNAAGKPLESDYDAKAKTKSRGMFDFKYIEPTIAPLPANLETYKERAITEFNKKHMPQDHKETVGDKAVEWFTKKFFS